MELAVFAAVAGAVISLARGGSLSSLSETRFRWVWLLFVALAVQLLFTYWSPGWLSTTASLWLLLGSTGVVAAFLLINHRLPGLALAGVGLALNVVVIAGNQAMPVSRSAVSVVGGKATDVEAGFKHEPLDDHTVFPVLADVIPVPGVGSILSAGDVLLLIGIAYLAYRRTAASRLAEEESSSEASG